MRNALALAVLVAALAGCGLEPGFGRLGPFQLTSGISWFFPEAATAFEYSSNERGCQVLAPDFSVTVDGEPVEADPGAATFDSQTGITGCRQPGFRIPRPPVVPGAVDVEARSGDDVLTAHLEWIGMKIQGVPHPPDGVELRRGERLPIALASGWEGLAWPSTATGRDWPWPWPAMVAPPVNGVLRISLPDVLWDALYVPSRMSLRVLPTSHPEYTSCNAPLGCVASTDVTGLAAPLEVDFVAAP